jgi:phosphate transport system substrate-binding protein
VLLVSYLIGCEQYEDENVAALTKAFFQTAVSEAGQKSAAENAGSAPSRTTCARSRSPRST